MCVCVCVCVCLCMYVCVRVCVCVRMIRETNKEKVRKYAFLCVFANVCACALYISMSLWRIFWHSINHFPRFPVSIWICVGQLAHPSCSSRFEKMEYESVGGESHINIYVYIYIYIYVYIYQHIYIHICICICIYIYTSHFVIWWRFNLWRTGFGCKVWWTTIGELLKITSLFCRIQSLL